MIDLFDPTESKARRDEGMARAALRSSDFMELALLAINLLPRGEYTGEVIRADLLNKGIEPGHPNAWGALINAAVRRGLIRQTGRYVPMQAKKSHARATQVYEI